MTDPVIGRIAEHGREDHRCEQDPDVEHAGRRKGSCDKKERVTREVRRDHETGFTKDDDEEEDVRPHPVLLKDHREVLVKMQYHIENIERENHVQDHLNRER
jgi:hypothetical protein